MPDQALRERAVDIIAERLGCEREKVLPDADFVGDLDADLLEIAEMLLALEEEFNVVFDEEATRLKTPGQILDLLESRVHE